MPVEARDPRRLHVFVGDKRKALSDRFSIVLNEDLATSLFGQGDPIGKIVTIGDLDFGGDYRVTGVVSVPKGTFGFGALISTMPQEFRGRLGNWMTVGQWRSFETYVLLAEGASTADLESKLPVFMETYMGAETRATNRYHLQQLTRTHLYSGRDYGIHGSGDIDQIYVFIALAGFILLVACVNFMNLATARSADRCREVGMRKAVGAVRWQLAGQFLAEATLLALVSFVLSLGAIQLSIPALNELTNKTLVLNPLWIPVLGLLSMGVGLLAGSYPALVLSGFRPAAVLRGTGGRDVGLSWLRGALVTFQFAVSICVIAITLVVESQLTFIRDKDLGFDKEQIIRLDLLYEDERVPKPVGTTDLNYRYDVVKRAFVQHANVLSATVTRWPQGTTSATGSFHGRKR